MNLKKEMACRRLPLSAIFGSIKETAEDMINDDKAELGALVAEYTKVALIVGLVLVPVGIAALIAMNTSGMSTAMIAALGSIGIVIIASVIMAILDKSMKTKKGK